MCSDDGNVRIQSAAKFSMAIANGRGSPMFEEGVSMGCGESQVLSDFRKGNGHGNTPPTASVNPNRHNIMNIVSVWLLEGVHRQRSGVVGRSSESQEVPLWTPAVPRDEEEGENTSVNVKRLICITHVRIMWQLTLSSKAQHDILGRIVTFKRSGKNRIFGPENINLYFQDLQ